jgi:hypothetical protein
MLSETPNAEYAISSSMDGRNTILSLTEEWFVMFEQMSYLIQIPDYRDLFILSPSHPFWTRGL